MIRAAGVLLFSAQSHRMLLVRRPLKGSAAGQWECPGGRMEPGEAPVHTMLRELAEETGYTGPVTVLAQRRITEQYTLFMGHIPREFRPRLTEHMAHTWTTLSELPTPLRPSLVEVFELVRLV